LPEHSPRTTWHLIFGTIQQYLLTPLGISVELEANVMSEPPRADVLLLRRDTARWTPEQFAVLPDGIRDTNARYILIEFKYSESISVNALLQTANNDRLYLQSHDEIKLDELKSFLISAKHPQQATLDKHSFYPVQAGIYRSNNSVLQSVTLISLNELPNTPNNVWLRCFASQKKHQEQAFEQLNQMGLQRFGKKLYWIVQGLRNLLFGRRPVSTEKLAMEPEEIMELGKFWEASYKANMTVEERLEGLSPEERLEGLSSGERLEGLSSGERLEGLSSGERLEGLSPKERLEGLSLEERLQEIAPEQIEAYLQKLQQSKSSM